MRAARRGSTPFTGWLPPPVDHGVDPSDIRGNGLGMTELTLDTQLTKEQRDYLVLVKSSGEALLSVINDILDFSKVESGKLELERIGFNLYNCVGDTMKTMALRAHEKGLEMAYDVGADVPPNLIGDPGRLRQILANLAGNAISLRKKERYWLKLPSSRKTRQR